MTGSPLAPTVAAPVPAAIVAAAKRIVRAVDPLQVILFGSYARGNAHRWSDVDLLVVISNDADRRHARDAAWDASRDLDIPRDIIVVTADQIGNEGDLVGTVIRPALREGKLLYDATALVRWDQTRRAVDVEVKPVTEIGRRAETRRWLRQARLDLRTAEVDLAASDLDPDPAAYQAQQAAEKALKAVLVFLQVDYPFSHDLDASRNRIPSGWPVKDEHPNLQVLSGWSYRARYPGDWIPPTREDARAAIAQARAILQSVERDLKAHGFVEED